MLSTGAAANATEGSSEDRESSTVELPVSELNIERASQNDAVTVAATTDVELSFDRPVVSSEASPEPTAAEEAAEVETEAAAEAQAEEEAQAAQEAEAAAEAQAQQEAQAAQEAEAAAESQAQQEAEAAQEAAEAENQSQADEQAQPAQQPRSQGQSQDQGQSQEQGQSQSQQAEPAAQESGESSQSESGVSTAGQSSSESSGGGEANSSVVSAAYSAVGSPYSYGGTSTSGFDCSGLINWAYDQAGQGGLPRTTHAMASSLPEVSSPQPGDIVLANGNSHGAIYIGNGQVISATSSGGVRVHGLHEGWHQVTSYHRPG